MRLCQSHWDALRGAIAARGLERFVSPNGADAQARLRSGAYEPLIMSTFALTITALKSGAVSKAADTCPACFIEVTCDCGEPGCGQRALDGAADGALKEATRLGLVATC